MANSPREIAVIGCGALGLTSALLAQDAGAKVTIYAKDRMPNTRSVRATGSWTPDSRIALEDAAAPGFGELWEQMARTSFKTYRRYLGLPGTPIEWVDHYSLSDGPSASAPPRLAQAATPRLQFAEYRDRIRDLTPRSEILPPGATPFPVSTVRRSSELIFNIADYGHTLFNDFLTAGGKFEHREFHAPAELAALNEKVVINCPGYGARALWRDESITPVRGQMNWLIPQADFHYGLYYRQVGVTPRRDGIGVQMLDGGDMKGYGIEDETPDRAEAERAVAVLADLSARMVGRS
jgi:glycine/D-amino acid oxidase-like deaminating enzyme